MESSSRKVFFLAVNTGYGKDGNPDSRLIKFHQERSGNGIYSSIVGNVVTPNGFGSNKYCLTISNNQNWKTISETIRSNGSVPGIQLSTAWSGYKGNQRFVATRNDDFSEYTEQFLNIKKTEIDHIFDDFYSGVNLAIDVGFEHIQIHAAHGYLLSLLVDPVFCKNSDYALEKLNNLINHIRNNNVQSSIRFSVKVGVQSIDRLRDSSIDNIISLDSDFFDISSGFYNINKHLIYPTSKSMLKSRYNHSVALSNKYPNKNFIFSGKSLSEIKTKIPENVSLGICRDLIANPKYLLDDSIRCENHKLCHYYSRGEKSLNCKMW